MDGDGARRRTPNLLPLSPLPLCLLRDLHSPAKGIDSNGGLPPDVAAFMKNPMLAIQTLAGGRAAPAFQESLTDEEGFQRDVQELRHLVATTEEEVHALHQAIVELEAQTHKQREDVLTQMYGDLSILPPDNRGAMVNSGDLGLEQQLSSLAERLLKNVRELEKKSAVCRLDISAMEEALRSLYAGILMEEKRQKERKRELEADELVCNTLRLKLQEAHRRVFDYRQREAFVGYAEAKYLEQMETIQRLRGELQACGLRLPVLEAGNTGGGIIATCNRFRWERRCARRTPGQATLPLPEGGVSMTCRRTTEMGEEGAMSNDDHDDPNTIVSRVLALPLGVLHSLQSVTLGDTGGRRSECEIGGSSGLRCRARQLGLSLQYQQHTEANPWLRRPAAQTVGESDVAVSCGKGGCKTTAGGVTMLIRGQRRFVDQFQLEVETAVAALQSPKDAELFLCDITPQGGGDGEVITISGTHVGDEPQSSGGRYHRLHLSPWREAARVAKTQSISSSRPPLPLSKDSSDIVDHPTAVLPSSHQQEPSSNVWGESFLHQLSALVPRASVGITAAATVTPASKIESSITHGEESAREALRAKISANISV